MATFLFFFSFLLSLYLSFHITNAMSTCNNRSNFRVINGACNQQQINTCISVFFNSTKDFGLCIVTDIPKSEMADRCTCIFISLTESSYLNVSHTNALKLSIMHKIWKKVQTRHVDLFETSLNDLTNDYKTILFRRKCHVIPLKVLKFRCIHV